MISDQPQQLIGGNISQAVADLENEKGGIQTQMLF